MPEFLNKIIEKITDLFFSFTKKLDDLSDKVFEQTGNKINFKYIILGILLSIFTIIMVKMILGWVRGFVFGE